MVATVSMVTASESSPWKLHKGLPSPDRLRAVWKAFVPLSAQHGAPALRALASAASFGARCPWHCGYGVGCNQREGLAGPGALCPAHGQTHCPSSSTRHAAESASRTLAFQNAEMPRPGCPVTSSGAGTAGRIRTQMSRPVWRGQEENPGQDALGERRAPLLLASCECSGFVR